MTAPTLTDRLTIRSRPEPTPLMYQSWRKLLFMHWQLPPEALIPFIPDTLEIDTFDGKAWIAITPFIVRNLRPALFPPLPLLSNFNEINVRTYVHHQRVPGVWFFSLDVNNLPAVFGARKAFHLPYFAAHMRFREEGNSIFYRSSRSELAAQRAEFEAVWHKGETLGEASPESLEFFLVERYCLYSMDGGQLYRSRIFHKPWKLQQAQLGSFRSTMAEGQGLPQPAETPLLHYSERQDVAVWPAEKVPGQRL